MSLKDQMPFFSDPPPWYYRTMAVVLGLAAAGHFVLLAFIVLRGHEYWPILIFWPDYIYRALGSPRPVAASTQKRKRETAYDA